jgi:hypothetical protein
MLSISAQPTVALHLALDFDQFSSKFPVIGRLAQVAKPMVT